MRAEGIIGLLILALVTTGAFFNFFKQEAPVHEEGDNFLPSFTPYEHFLKSSEGMEGLMSIEGSTQFEQFVNGLDYPLEIHYVTTADDYILKVYRIPGKKGEAPSSYENRKRTPMFLQHGLLDSSDTFILNDEDKSIGFILANAGYDVWFGNVRGNKYCLQKTTSDYKDKDFWNFTWNEMANTDLPAMLSYVTDATKYEQVLYVGHSQGTVMVWAGASDPASRDLVNQKIKLFIALGPAPYIHHTSAKIVTIASDLHLSDVLGVFGIRYIFMPSPWGLIPDKLISILCKLSKMLCDAGFYLISDMDPSLLNNARAPIFMDHFPSGTSILNMDMWSQQARTGKFQKYDFGSKENEKRYGSKDPPAYDLSQVKIPTAMFVGTKDRLADAEDCEALRDKLEAAGKSLISYKEYDMGHLGFLLDKNITFWDDAMVIIEKYTPTTPSIE
mmetsp:Transcript_55942/g.63853  ORF Transcript_55942/g.63853 Transcript_55942/m.63853 type:complete len:444 (+) Transcript_55942:138-1469(+)